ncbi:DUF4424 domain-containing protein [Microvirga pudoricolor]|uniref:DUF4424 domain-containing protein n=1 Tax=Microvirga pudoricolor TaxID=2778729 RepID=UPI001950737B|nr:DUF4424 domain-containing protein [Microvirga pudoricolor]MBM6593401.1 DUF4424 domain-containing protein [Microvirga pudoricolor]
MPRLGVLTAALLLLAGPALANDTMANFAAGGLTFSRTDAVAMLSEDLFLSIDEVRVRYRFRNLTDKDVSGTVAFPMPDIKANPFSPVAYPDGPPDDLMRFSVTVDGRPVAARLDKRALANGIDVTQTLAGLGLPAEPFAEPVLDRLKRLDAEQRRRLEEQGIVDVLEGDPESAADDEVIPTWVLSGAYHWPQTFPAGADVLVEHRYRPSVGGAVLDLGSMAKVKSASGLFLDQEGVCIDADFVGGARRWAERERRKPAEPQARFIDYILVTGGNWAGPIRSFTLTVDKGSPDNLVSFCGEGVKKVSPTRFEMRKTDFTPTRDIRVLILDTGRR